MDTLYSSLGTNGTVIFRKSERGGVELNLENVCVEGMRDGKHGFHIHESGNMSDGCKSMGGHYDPHGMHHHGGPRDHRRHGGDLGNVESLGGCLKNVTLHAPDVTLEGIRGRGIVLHEREDDHGQGGTEESRTTGSAGGRVTCGTIE